MPFFEKKAPRSLYGKQFSVRQVNQVIPAFRIESALDDNLIDDTNCDGSDPRLIWKKSVRDAVLNTSSAPLERNFFEMIAGGATEVERIPAKRMAFRQLVDYDYNMIARDSVTGAAAGAITTFTLARSMHSINGTKSFVDTGWTIYNYPDKQVLRVTAVDTTNDYAHQISVIPHNPQYQVNIRANTKMFVSPAKQMGGYRCNSGYAGRFDPPGYFYDMTMGRLISEWNIPTDMLRGFEDVLMFGFQHDDKGNEIDCWDYAARQHAREDLQLAWNFQLFLGQRIRNAQILNTYLDGDKSYPGTDGYDYQVRNGGGYVYSYDQDLGIDPNTDMASILVDRDSQKKSSEYIMMSSLPFDIDFDNNLQRGTLKREQGQLFNTFDIVNGPNNMMKVTKMGIDSINYYGMTIHKIRFGALSDSRLIGNDYLRRTAYLMPSTNLRDSNDRVVPPLEMFVNYGCKETAGHEEWDYDGRKQMEGCEQVGGYIAEARGLIVHDTQNHIIFDPQSRC